MKHEKVHQPEAEQQLNSLLRRALATPPISNKDILKRSKESKPKGIGNREEVKQDT